MNFNMFTMMTVLVATDLVSLCYGKTLPTEASTSNALTPSALTEVKPAERSKAPASSVPTASALAEAPASAASTLGEIKRIKDIHPAKRSKAELIRLRELSGKTKPEQVFGGRSPGGFQRVAQAQLDKFFAEKAALKASDSLATDVPESSFNRTPAEPAQPSLAAAALQGGATEEALIEQETAQAELGKHGASIEATALSEDASKESMESMKENMKPQVELVVTLWNIISFQKSKNPFEFVNAKPALRKLDKKVRELFGREPSALPESSGTLGEKLHNLVGGLGKKKSLQSLAEYLGADLSAEKLALPSLSALTRTKAEEFIKAKERITLKEFADQFQGSKASKVDQLLPRRAGLNDFFVCQSSPTTNNVERLSEQMCKESTKKQSQVGTNTVETPCISFEDVFFLITFDLILNKAKTSVKGIDAAGNTICQEMFPAEGEVVRMRKLRSALDTMQTDVAILQEIPASWLIAETRTQKKEGDRATLSSVLGEAWHVVAPPEKSLDSADNTVILLKKEKLPAPEAAKGDPKILSVTVKPKGMGKSVCFMGLHLKSGSKKTDNDERKKGILKINDPSLCGEGISVIAASDTNGEPREPTYMSGDYSFEGDLIKDSVFRATNAPWGNGDKKKGLPAFGTCNKQRTAMQGQLGKLKPDRLMKDNIYFKPVLGSITIKQMDLCQAGRTDSCRAWTFKGQLHCFSEQDPDNALPGNSDGTGRFPTTCGYVGEETKLPQMSEDFGISDHAPITARFKLTDQ